MVVRRPFLSVHHAREFDKQGVHQQGLVGVALEDGRRLPDGLYLSYGPSALRRAPAEWVSSSARRYPPGGRDRPRPGWPGRTGGRRYATSAPPACGPPPPACDRGSTWTPWPRPGRPTPPARRRAVDATGPRPRPPRPGARRTGRRRRPRCRPVVWAPNATGPAGDEVGVADQQAGPVEAATRGPGHRVGVVGGDPAATSQATTSSVGTASKGTWTHRLTMVARWGAGRRPAARRRWTVGAPPPS